MATNVFHKLAGTLLSSFRIGIAGPAIRQGNSDPRDGNLSGSTGDLYIMHGNTPSVFQKTMLGWERLGYQSEVQMNREEVIVSSFTADNTQRYLGVNYNGEVNINLPSGTAEKQFIVKDEGGFASSQTPIVIHAASGETIDGQSTFVMTDARSSITLFFGSEWHVI